QYAPRLRTLQDRLQRAQQKVEKERSQLSQQKFQTALSVGASILGAFLGRKAQNSGTLGRATTAARSAGRISRESQDVDQASDSLEPVQQRIPDLQTELESEIARVQGAYDPAAIVLESIEVAPRKSDIAVGEVALVWR